MPATYLNDWEMEGTTGSIYTIVAKTKNGVVGYRVLEDGNVRVRVEPEVDATDTVHNALPNEWKKVRRENDDGYDNHCSVVVNINALYKALVQGFIALS